MIFSTINSAEILISTNPVKHNLSNLPVDLFFHDATVANIHAIMKDKYRDFETGKWKKKKNKSGAKRKEL